MGGRGRVGLLLSSSVAALLIGGGAPAAFAACANNINAAFDNPSGNTTACVAVTNTSFTGDITNEGTITPGGITFNNGTITGSIASSGIISGGISLDSASAITSAGTAILITGPTFSGGISNAGTISGATGGIIVSGVTTFSGGISNSGTITAGFTGIAVNNVSNFSGGITNTGAITANFAGIGVTDSATFAGPISNHGTIVAGTGILVGCGCGVTLVTGGITNSGTIAAISAAIRVTNVATFSGAINNSGSMSGAFAIVVSSVGVFGSATPGGGIVNSGTIAASGIGISVLGVSTFQGWITNGGTITAAFGSGILVAGVGTFSGGIVNDGTIVAGGIGPSGGGIVVLGVDTFQGGITNRGSISSTNAGISVLGVSTFVGGINNGGTISAQFGAGIVVQAVETFSGGISNGGTIFAGQAGIHVCDCVTTFLNGITNSGLITAAGSGIFVGAVSTFAGGISNSGTLAAQSGNGVAVVGATTFSGGISNGGIITAQGVPALGFVRGAGILVSAVSVFGSASAGGGITNTGSITAERSGVLVQGVGSFFGGIANSGTITAGLAGIAVGAVGATGSFRGGISNGGLIALSQPTGSFGIFIDNVSQFSGGVRNGGTITGAGVGIALASGVGISTFSGGITNMGSISANTGILVGSVGAFDGHIVNAGTISGTVAAIDLSGATVALTVDQNGGLLSGDVKLSTNGDMLNVRGGTINGNIIDQNATGTINFTLGAATFTYGTAFGFTNVGQVNVNSGTVILDGANSANNVAVNGGVLQVGDAGHPGATLAATVDVIGGTLAGHGTVIGGVAIEDGGVLAPGGSLGTLTISGSLAFNAGSTYAVQIAPGAGNNSATVVNGGPGTVTINGGTVVVTPQIGHYNATNYVIVETTGGVGGTFAGLTVNGSFVGTMKPDYTTIPGDVLLDVSAGFALSSPLPVLSQNQQNVLNGLLASSNLSTPFQNLALLTGPHFANALTQFSGEAGAAFLQGAFQSGDLFLNLMVNPFLDGRFGSGGGFGAAMGFAAEAPPALPEAAAAFASAMPVKAPPHVITTSAPAAYRVWGSAFGGAESVDGNATVGSHTTTSRVFGFAAGVDYPIAPATTLGFALAGGGTNWGLDGGLGGGHSDTFQAGAYGSHRWGAAYVSGALSYNFHDVTTDRNVTVAGVDRLTASFQAHGLGTRLEGGYRYATPWLGITPYGAVQVQSIFLPGYGETATAGSNQFALAYASQTATATRSELGAWFDKSTLLHNGALLTLYGRAAWAHDFGDTSSASAIFQALPGSNFVVNGAVPARDGALVTAGALYRMLNGWSFQAKFDGEFSSTTNVYSGTGVVKRIW